MVRAIRRMVRPRLGESWARVARALDAVDSTTSISLVETDQMHRALAVGDQLGFCHPIVYHPKWDGYP